MVVGVTTVSFSANELLLKKLSKKGVHVKKNEFGRRLSKEELIGFLSDCDSAIIGLDKIDASILEFCPRLKIISKYGVGIDNIDFEDCFKYGVKVVYPKGINKRSVAEMAVGMMIGLSRNLYVGSNALKSKQWIKNGGFEISGKTVGIIGFGHIGKDVVGLLQPFGCRIIVNDINPDVFKNLQYKVNQSSKEDLYSNSDIISIHTPLTNDTRNMINNATISKMKDGVILLNTARGGIIDEHHVAQAIRQCKIAGLGIDAYEVEPPYDSSLLDFPNVYCTPHIGGNSQEAVAAMGEAAIEGLF